MSKDIRDLLRANMGFAASMFNNFEDSNKKRIHCQKRSGTAAQTRSDEVKKLSTSKNVGTAKRWKKTTIYLPSKRYDIPKVIGLKVYTCFPCLIGIGVIVIPHFKTEIPGIVWVQLCYDQFNPRVCWFSPITIGLFTNMVSTCSLHPIVFHDIDMPIIFLYWLLLFRCKYHEMSAHFVGYINSIND